MDAGDSPQNGGKVYGYLEMKSRLNFWRRWRKYWFVLDGKMLLYYKSKEKYENLGRCKGFLNMSLAQAVQPCSIARSYPLEVITRTRTVQLSACDEENRQKWLNALLSSLRLPEVSAPILERLSSRLSVTAFPPTRKSCPTDSKLMIDLPEENQATPTNTPHPEFNSNSVTKDETGVVNDKEEWPELGQRRRSLYEEIVEEVLEMTGRKLARDRKDCHSVVPPKPPRIGNKSGSLVDKRKNCGVDELDIESKKEGVKGENAELMTEEKVEIKLESVEKNEERPRIDENVQYDQEVVIGENEIKTEVKLDVGVENKNRVNFEEKLYLVKLDIECEPYESANESSYVTAESSEFEDDVLSMSSNDNLDLKQPGSLCNMLEDNDDVFMVESKENKLIRVESLPVSWNFQVSLQRKFSL